MPNTGQPKICIAHPSLFTPREIEQFEKEILSNKTANEHDASAFFARNPKFLLLGEGKAVRRETVLFGPDDNPIGRVDFFRQSFGRKTWDLIELKQPHMKVFSGVASNHPYVSASVHKAINQAQDYRQLIDNSLDLRMKLNAKGIKVIRPEMIVIAGRDNNEIDPELVAALLDRIRQQGVRLFTLDHLFAFAKEHCELNRVIILPAKIFSLEDSWAIIRKDNQLRITHINDLAAQNLGVRPIDAIGRNEFDFYAREFAERYHKDDLAILRGDVAIIDKEEMHTRREGDRSIVRIIKTPIRDTQGHVVGIEIRYRMLNSSSIRNSA